MLTFLLLVGTGIFCKLSGTEVVKFGGLLLITVIADICLIARFLTLYFKG
jgi:hypothetical protein